MSIEAWSFLISRNRYLDYRTVVAPDFVSGTTTFLARAAGGDLSEDGQANYREIHDSKDGDMTLVFRVIEAVSKDIDEEGNGILKDSFGRAISLVEGIVVRGRHPSIVVTQETFNHIHAEVIAHYRTFWNHITPEAASVSPSFTLSNVETESCLQLIPLKTLILEASSTKAKNQAEAWHCTEELPISHEVSSLVYSVKGEILAVTNRPSLKIWLDDEGKDYYPDLKLANTKFIVPSSDGEEFAICYVSLPMPPTKDFIVLWNRKTDERLEFHAKERSWVEKITSVTISRDKQFFATCNRDGLIKIWDIPSKMELDLSLVYRSCVRSSAFSPNGQLLASGYDDGTIKLWKTKTGRVAHSSDLHKTPVKVVAFSPDGQLLVSADAQGKIKFWNVETLTEIKKLDNAHTLPVNAITFSPDGKVIASGSDDGFLKLWSVKTGANLFTSPEEDKSVNAIAFGIDAKVLVSGGSDKYVKIWNQSS